MKTLIDIDDQLLASAGEILGTTTKRSTVEAALREVLDRHRRVAAIEELHSLTFTRDVIHPRFQGEAWG